MFSVKKRALAKTVSAAVAVAVLVVVPAEIAFADPSVLTPATQTVEYGQNWTVSGQVPAPVFPNSDYQQMKVASGGTTTNLGDNRVFNGSFGIYDGDFDYGLGVGTHTFTVSFSGSGGATTSTTATVIITPAKIVTTTTIVPDPNNALNAIITSQLTGDFVNQLPSCNCEGQDGYDLPAGTWNLNVTDSNGKSVLTKSYDQPAKALPTFVNYWPSVPAGQTFSAVSTFTPKTGGSNFTLTSQKFSWTSAKAAPSQGSTSPSNAPKPPAVKAAAFAPPVVVFYGALLVAIILLALNIVLLVINRRTRNPQPVSATDGAGS